MKQSLLRPRIPSAFAVMLCLAPGVGHAAPASSAPASGPVVEIVSADLPAIMNAVRAPGAKAVLLNIWASWCEPCREEMPGLLRYHREHKAAGLRLVLVSADGKAGQRDAEEFLAKLGVDFRSYIKVGDDMDFINALDRRWDGTIPASFAYDHAGKPFAFWSGQVTYQELERKLDPILGNAHPKPTRRKP
jgi:thiol-disulfide isomerase/thioredoxin